MQKHMGLTPPLHADTYIDLNQLFFLKIYKKLRIKNNIIKISILLVICDHMISQKGDHFRGVIAEHLPHQ